MLLLVGIADRGDLDIDQLDHRVRTAARCEQLARRGEPTRAEIGRCFLGRIDERLERLGVVGVVLDNREERGQVSHGARGADGIGLYIPVQRDESIH